ncbi:MAG: hypothetical protein ACP5KG_12990, partial [Myxococcota bacterium]
WFVSPTTKWFASPTRGFLITIKKIGLGNHRLSKDDAFPSCRWVSEMTGCLFIGSLFSVF